MIHVPAARRATPEPGTPDFAAACDQLFAACCTLAGQGRAAANLHEKALMTFTVPYEPHFHAVWEAVEQRLGPEYITLDWAQWEILVVPRAAAQERHWNGSFNPAEHAERLPSRKEPLVVMPTRLRYLSVDLARQTAAQLLLTAEYIDKLDGTPEAAAPQDGA